MVPVSAPPITDTASSGVTTGAMTINFGSRNKVGAAELGLAALVLAAVVGAAVWAARG